MAVGKLIVFDCKKGYGLINQDNGDKEIFVHARELIKSGIIKLDDEKYLTGLILDYEIGFGKHNKKQAVNIKVITSDQFQSTETPQ